MSRKLWKVAEISFLKENYDSMNTRDIANKFNRTLSSVHTFAWKLNLKKPIGSQRNSKVEILLDGSLQSHYWIGFMLADGTFHKQGNTLRLDQSVADLSHLEKFRDYLQCTNAIGLSSKQCKHVISTTAHFTAINAVTIPELVKQFDIRSNKTYFPPNMRNYNTTDDQMLALIIGFIDGDGYIKLSPSDKNNKKYNRIKINIEIHGSWLDNLTFMKEFLYKKVNKFHRLIPPKINSSGLAHTTIACTAVTDMLNQFIQINNLYVLERKWNKFHDIKRFNTHNNTMNANEEMLSIREKFPHILENSKNRYSVDV